MLLENRACLTIRNKDGKTALEIAKEKNHKIIYRIIYEKMIESMTSKGNTNVCGHEKCQTTMKRTVLQKLEETFTLKESKNCVVCFEQRNGTFVLQPYGHAKTCETCCVKVVEETKICPLCRGNVSKYQKIFN